MDRIPKKCEFTYEEFYSLAIQDGKYTGIKRKGMKDFERGIIYEDNESLIMSEEKWTAYDLVAGVEICKERDFERLYEKVADMWEEIKKRRETDVYKDLANIYMKVLDMLDSSTQ